MSTLNWVSLGTPVDWASDTCMHDASMVRMHRHSWALTLHSAVSVCLALRLAVLYSLYILGQGAANTNDISALQHAGHM